MPKLSNIPQKILVGPTAAGKSDVIHEIAHTYGHGILSADAMMIYKGMDIGTAKPTLKERQGLIYAGIDLAEPNQLFSVHDYLVSAQQVSVPDVSDREWVVAGGTGLYVRCLLSGLDEGSGPSNQIRLEAEEILENEGFDGLKSWCRDKDSTIDDQISEGDRDNPRRWVRAIERGTSHDNERTIPAETRIVGLAWDKADLEKRIIKRVDIMYDSGLLDEVSSLREQYPDLSLTATKAIGYSEAMDVLDNRATLDDAKNRTIIRTRQYAKRQMTWFRNQFNTQWISVSDNDSISSLADQVTELWRHDG